MGKNTIKGMKSVFGDAQRTCYVYVDELEKMFKRKYSVLVIDGVDGQHVMPFVRKNNNVTCFEENETYYYGGQVDGFKVKGLKAKLEYEKLHSKVKVINKNFYEEKVTEKYDFVYVYRSLHLEGNRTIPMIRKMRKILSSVKEQGYVYILYHIANNEKDYIHYPKEQYLRTNDMKHYFSNEWEIINLKEEYRQKPHKAHPFHNIDHSHRVGYLLAKKIKTRSLYKYHYKIISSD